MRSSSCLKVLEPAKSNNSKKTFWNRTYSSLSCLTCLCLLNELDFQGNDKSIEPQEVKGEKIVTIFGNYLYLQPLFVKLMLQNTSATFFHIFLNKFFSGKNQELRKGLFFKKKSEIKPTTPTTSSTRAMKITGKIFVKQNCRQTESVSLVGLSFPV